MKSLSPAIVGVTSGVAAFVVLDLLRAHGVEAPRFEWDRPVLVSAAVPEQGGVAEESSPSEMPRDRAVPTATSQDGIAAGAGETVPIRDVELAQSTVRAGDAVAAGATSGTTSDVASERVTATSEAPTATPPGPSSSESDLARAAERAKALAAAMERLGRRLDGTANRGFPR